MYFPRFYGICFVSGAKSHLRKTQNKTQPLASTLRKMRESRVYRMELDFYNFAKDQFNFVKQRVFDVKDGFLQVRKQQFMFEKIRPREFVVVDT